ncbi:MAG: hypothetical protein ACFFC7_16740 [Candidatus Hermodarchaeota archaeon]
MISEPTIDAKSLIVIYDSSKFSEAFVEEKFTSGYQEIKELLLENKMITASDELTEFNVVRFKGVETNIMDSMRTETKLITSSALGCFLPGFMGIFDPTIPILEVISNIIEDFFIFVCVINHQWCFGLLLH